MSGSSAALSGILNSQTRFWAASLPGWKYSWLSGGKFGSAGLLPVRVSESGDEGCYEVHEEHGDGYWAVVSWVHCHGCESAAVLRFLLGRSRVQAQ